MKRLETTQTKAQSFFSDARRAVTTSVSSLLTWTKMCLSVGFVIIMVVILGGLLDVLVRMSNYRNGTKLQTDLILRDLMTSLVTRSVERSKRNLNSRRNL